jgi:hypothetical protein
MTTDLFPPDPFHHHRVRLWIIARAFDQLVVRLSWQPS